LLTRYGKPGTGYWISSILPNAWFVETWGLWHYVSIAVLRFGLFGHPFVGNVDCP